MSDNNPKEKEKRESVQAVTQKSVVNEENHRKSENESKKLDIIKDVSLQGKVILGRGQISLGDLLNLHEGSTVKLDRLEGELVEIMISDRCIAMGEVIVIGEHFGVRIIDFTKNTI